MNSTRIVITSDTHNLEGDVFWQQIKTLDPDIVVHCGDWTMDTYESMEAIDRMKKNLQSKQHVLTVLGNHDYWAPHPLDCIWRDWQDFNFGGHVQCLEGNVVDLMGLTFAGYSGWYSQPYPFSRMNDCKYVSKENWELLVKQKKESVERILDYNGKIDVLITHFEVSDTELKLFAPKVKRIVYGHWHDHVVDEMREGVRVINAGSSYHAPKYVALEL